MPVRVRGIGDGVAVDLDAVVYEVHDPILRDARTRVEAALLSPVVGQRGVGHLDHE